MKYFEIIDCGRQERFNLKFIFSLPRHLKDRSPGYYLGHATLFLKRARPFPKELPSHSLNMRFNSCRN